MHDIDIYYRPHYDLRLLFDTFEIVFHIHSAIPCDFLTLKFCFNISFNSSDFMR